MELCIGAAKGAYVKSVQCVFPRVNNKLAAQAG